MSSIKNSGIQKIFITLGVIFLVAIVYILLQISYKKQEQQNTPKSTGIEKKEVAAAEIPGAIPKDAPFLQSGTVLQNTTTASTTKKQAVRVCVTDTTAETALQDYKTYFQKNGWVTVSTYAQNGTSLIGVSKGDISLSVSIKPTKQPNQTTIELTAISNL